MPPLQSPREARETVNAARQESVEHWPDWTSTRDDIIDEISKQNLSTDPQDLATLLDNATQTSDYNVKLQEYLKDELEFSQEVESIMLEGLTPVEAEIARLQKSLKDENPEVTQANEEFKALLLRRPMIATHLGEDVQFGRQFRDAVQTQMEEFSDRIQGLYDLIGGERERMLERLRESLGVEEVQRKYNLFCLLANSRVAQAQQAVVNVQKKVRQLRTEASTLRQTLKDELQKTADRDAANKSLLDEKDKRMLGLERAADDTRELNDLRKEKIKTLETQLTDTKTANDSTFARMNASLGEKDATIHGLESEVKALEANQKQSEATIAGQAQELTNAREDAAATIGRLDADNRHLETTVTELEDTVKSLQDQLSALTVASGAKDAKIAQLEDAKKNRRSQLFDKDVDIANLRVAAQASSTGSETAHQIYQPTESLKHGLEVAVRMIRVLISDNAGIEAGDDIQAVMEQKCINLPIDDIVVDNVALPSLRLSNVAPKSAINHALCFWMAVVSGHNSVEVIRHAQGVFENFKEVGRMKRWTYDAIQELIHRLKATEDNTLNRIMWIIAMQGLQLISSLVPGTSALEDLAVDVKAAVDNTSSAGLQYMIRQLLSSLADAQVNGKFAWLSGYPAGVDVLDHSNSALAQGTKLIGEAPDLFFFVSTGGLAVFTADDVETVAWDDRVVRGWEIKLNFKADASVKLDTIILARNIGGGPVFKWVEKFLESKQVIHSRFDT
ncbi:MAG: hypothetical protein Q9177_005809 [Variospora cf. flavescens]